MSKILKPLALPRIPTQSEVEVYLRKLDAKKIYQDSIIQRKGLTTDGIPVTEAIAEILLREDLLNSIQMITRERSYCVKHSKEKIVPNSNRAEDILAIKIFKACDFAVDYQVPLKNKQNDRAGKIDLLLRDGNVLILSELKKDGSSESLLRAVLEVETYWRILDKEKLLIDFAGHGSCSKSVQKSVVIFKNSRQYNELCESKRPLVLSLMKKYGIKVISAEDLEIRKKITYIQ